MKNALTGCGKELHTQGVVIPIGAVVTAATGVKKRSRAVFGVGQAVKDNFQT